MRELAAEERNALFDRVLADISIHGNVRQALRENKANNDGFYSRLAADPEAAERYARAKQQGMDAVADDTLRIADEVESDAAAVAKAKLQIETRKWLLAKLRPKVYGDRVEMEHSGQLAVTFTPGDASVL